MNYVDKYEDSLKKLEGISLYGFKGFQIDKLLTIQTKELIIGESTQISFFHLLKNVITNSFSDGYKYDFNNINGCKCVLFYSHLHSQRADYVRFMETIASTTEACSLMTGECRKGFSKIFHFDCNSILLPILAVCWYIYFKCSGVESLFIKHYVNVLVQMKRWLSILKKNKEQLKSIGSLVTIFDSREFENVLTQYVRKLGVVTATLQHGHFGVMSYNSINNYYLDIAYKGFVSDYFLAWGNYSKNISINAGLKKDQVIIVGCPEFILKRYTYNISESIGLVFDGGEGAISDNIIMLDIALTYASENNKDIIVKLHPSDKIENYPKLSKCSNVKIFNGSLDEYAQCVEFSICGNSSVLVQLLAYNKPIYRFKPSFNYDMYDFLSPWSFNNYDDFVKVKNAPNDYFEKLNEITPTKDVESKYHDTLTNLTNYPHFYQSDI